MNKIEEARRILEENGQGHIKVENEELADQILHIDFERLKTLDEEITHPWHNGRRSRYKTWAQWT